LQHPAQVKCGTKSVLSQVDAMNNKDILR